MAIILFGGSFNPVHLGHLAMAKAALNRFPSATLLWMPAACSPFKTNQRLVAEHHRLAMCKLVARDDPRMVVSDLEFTMEKPSYTVHTVKKLQEMYNEKIYFLCGADAFLTLFQWKNIEALAKMVTFLVANREETSWEVLNHQKEKLSAIGGETVFLEMEPWRISSTQLRETFNNSCEIQKWIHPNVWRYIQENGLYREC